MIERKTVAVILLMAAVPALMFAGGAAEEPAREMAAETGPQYGGTITSFMGLYASEPPNPDVAVGNALACMYLAPMQEKPVIGDFPKYGPEGTGDWAFQLKAYVPDRYQKGALLDSWETTYEKLTWHVTPGIHWAPNETQQAWMEPRELTADDVVQDIKVFWESPWGSRFKGILKDVYATDKYTVVMEYDKFSHNLQYFLGYEERAVVSPPEMREAGPDRWENQVGTGAYLFEEYVPGQYMSYVKNPDYRETWTIDGEEYQLPFTDRLVMTLTQDESTKLAALRTGKFDLYFSVPISQWNSLARTNPDLQSSIYQDNVVSINMRQDQPPFNDFEVRRALMIGTDVTAFQKMHHAEDHAKHYYPTLPTNPAVSYSYEELPAEAKELYDYDPEKAKKMLAEAGYPNGFEIDYWVHTRDSALLDNANLLEDMWAKIGVKINIKSMDYATHRAAIYKQDYTDAYAGGHEAGNPIGAIINFGPKDAFLNHDFYTNPRVEELSDQIERELNENARNQMIKEAGLAMFMDVRVIPLYLPPKANYWWPWLKNYHGEVSLQDGHPGTLFQYLWIDQNLKTEMGFK
jgi:peptide/nickel transport system substrate-binding protein